MGKRFKDKHSVKEERKEKKRRIKEEQILERRTNVEIQKEPQIYNNTKQTEFVEPLQEKQSEAYKTAEIPKVTEEVKQVPKKSKRKSGRKKVIFFLIVICILIAPAIYLRDYTEIAENTTNTITNGEFSNEITEDGKTEIVDADIPDAMGDYNVLGKIVIDKIGVTKNILDQTTDESLKLSVTKFYGPNLNEVGNLCLSGHNYKDTFGYLGKMEKGDTFYIVDKENFVKVTYRIYDQFTVNATDLECLDQETDGKKEVTLITCNPGGVTRLITKACEV